MIIEELLQPLVWDSVKWRTGLTNYARKELVCKKLIENKSGKYELTEKGRLVSRKLKGV